MRVLHGQDISSEVIKLIDRSQKVVIIVSAYYKPWGRLSTAIQNALIARKLSVVMFLRGGEKREDHLRDTADLRALGLKVHLLERLHAKFYANEAEAIVTSMNLHSSSALDSWEIGVHFAREDREALTQVAAAIKELNTQAQAEAARIAALGERETGAVLTAVASAPPTARAARAAAAGACIRCGEDIKLNVDRPFCRSCYAEWAEYENEDYKESFCHTCGEESKTSKARPQCRKCYRTSVTA